MPTQLEVNVLLNPNLGSLLVTLDYIQRHNTGVHFHPYQLKDFSIIVSKSNSIINSQISNRWA